MPMIAATPDAGAGIVQEETTPSDMTSTSVSCRWCYRLHHRCYQYHRCCRQCPCDDTGEAAGATDSAAAARGDSAAIHTSALASSGN